VSASGSRDGPSPPAGGRLPSPGRINIDAILRGRQEIIIEHRDEEYRLRITSNGKLLLTK
jgi:hemin uptake protein HemP